MSILSKNTESWAAKSIIFAKQSLTVTSHKPQAASHKLQATSCKPQAASHKPQATSHRLNLRPETCDLRLVTCKGLTLIEMIVVIVVLGIAIPPLLNMWADISWRSVRSEALADASFYAQELMEEIKTKRFDEKTSGPWTDSSNFGAAPDGENRADRSAFDDVDDFVNCADPAVITPAPGYSRSVTVDYIWLNGTAWQTCGAVPCAAASTCTNCNECCYKRIAVTVSRTDSVGTSAALTALVSAH